MVMLYFILGMRSGRRSEVGRERVPLVDPWLEGGTAGVIRNYSN